MAKATRGSSASAADDASSQQGKTNVAARSHELKISDFQELRSRSLMPHQRRRAGHIRAHGDRPDRELVPRKQIAGKAQQQRQDQEEHAHDPVEFPRRLVAPR